MKIEKINDNHIRCTLNAGDLLARKMKVSELAYGSEKAKMLFKDIMDQAGAECGFEADDIPLMIEAIPVSSECIVLNVIKVEDPEELDTRFSKFAPSVLNDEMSSEDGEFLLEDFFKRLGRKRDLVRWEVRPLRILPMYQRILSTVLSMFTLFLRSPCS